MNEKFKLVDFEPIIREVVDSGGEFTMKTNGTSMLPMLSDGNDVVVLVKPGEKLRRSDVIFYKRQNGQYVLHRIVGVHRGTYVLRGDNQIVNEHGVKPEQIIAVMRAYIKDGRRIDVESAEYKRYLKRLSFIYCGKLLKSSASHVKNMVFGRKRKKTAEQKRWNENEE